MECLSIPGGTTDSVTSKLEIYDITKFDNLIIIVGGNDSSDKTDLESFHDKYNNLIKSVKLKNPKCKLFLCMFCPRGDTDVTNINDIILQLCQENNLTCIDDNINFYAKKKKNERKHHFYKPRDSILSCFGKLFTAVLNLRLHKFLNDHDILEENQAGFRAGYSTCELIFSLHALIGILKAKKQKLFCSFLDFSNAFDSVWRVELWSKLLQNNINGKFFRIVFNMYQGIKSCISFNGSQSSFFPCLCGVRQGENLSLVLFALFLNDLG